MFTHKFFFPLTTVNRIGKKISRKAPKIKRRAEKESSKGDISKKQEPHSQKIQKANLKCKFSEPELQITDFSNVPLVLVT